MLDEVCLFLIFYKRLWRSCFFTKLFFDTGGGDDGTMTVIMMEILRVISKQENPLKHSIIFVFNGCEENELQGSHAFITQHKWAAEVK
jgi:Zn-dependent M28 family amino/carboxypeptidase